MASPRWILAIDFGTSYTVAAGLAEGRAPEVIEVQGERRTPSVVLVEGPSHFVVGRVADDLSGTNPQAVLRAPKSRLGDQAPAVLSGRPYPVAELVAALLADVYREGVRHFGGPPAEVRLTHPATWNRPRLLRLVEAAAKAGISEPVLVPEPVAAALAYFERGDLPDGAHVAVYDLGGGTFDTAVVRNDHGAFHVIGRAGGDATVGGELFDEILANFIGEGLDPATWEQIQLAADPQWRQVGMVLRNEARRAKETLSAHEWADVLLPLPTGAFQRRVTREEFEELIEPYIDETVSLLGRCIVDAGLRPSDLAAIQLVGGASRIPLVERSVSWAFPGLTVHRRGDPKTAVAIGALAATGPSTTPIAQLGGGSTEEARPISSPPADLRVPPTPAPVLPPPGARTPAPPAATPPAPAAPAPATVAPSPPPFGGPAPAPGGDLATTPLPVTPPPTGGRPRRRGPLIAAGAVIGALAIGGVAIAVTKGGGGASTSDTTTTRAATSTTLADTTTSGATTTSRGRASTTSTEATTSTSTTIEETTTTETSTSAEGGDGPAPKPDGLVGIESMRGVIPYRPYSKDFADRVASTEHGAGLNDFSYAAEAYDAFVVIALAAEEAQTDSYELANMIVRVVQDGEKCSTYAECKQMLDDGVDIDYDGQTGTLDMDQDGDMTFGSFLTGQFGADSHLDPSSITARTVGDPPEAVPSLGTATTGRAASDDFVIGGLVPMTGFLGFLGQQMAAGLELAVADVNEAGGALGVEVQLDLRDSGDSNDTLIGAAKDLAAGNVAAVVGPATADDVYQVFDIFTEAGITMVSPGAWDVGIDGLDDQGLFFRTAPSLDLEAKLISEMVQEDGNRSVYVVVSDDSFGNQIADWLQAWFAGTDINLMGVDRFTVGTDFATYVQDAQRIALLGPDAIVFCGSDADVDVFDALVDRGLGPTQKYVYGCRTDMFDAFGDAITGTGD